MLEPLREFKIGKPQIFAGLLLLAFLAQCLWVAGSRRFSDLEYEYMASGHQGAGRQLRVNSPATTSIVALTLRLTLALRNLA
ncbi:MAG TPA: hypothetical protein VG759_06255, partial [Candidatus Angelobacter sp.]|nr:hypothetical protein [Candidatus Angelobacter sp.]